MSVGHYDEDDACRIYFGVRANMVPPVEPQAAAIISAGMMIANSIVDLADSIHKLGNNDASTHMGAIEALGKAILDAADKISGTAGGIEE